MAGLTPPDESAEQVYTDPGLSLLSLAVVIRHHANYGDGKPEGISGWADTIDIAASSLRAECDGLRDRFEEMSRDYTAQITALQARTPDVESLEHVVLLLRAAVDGARVSGTKFDAGYIERMTDRIEKAYLPSNDRRTE